MEGGEVETDRVGQPLRADQFGDEGLPRRQVERRADAEEEGEHVHVPGDGRASDRQDAERGRAERQPALGELENQTLVEPVGDEAAVRRQGQHGQELQGRGDADGDARTAGQLQDQPVLGHRCIQVPMLETKDPAT